MKKRLRKKLKRSEFQELGFFVTGTFNSVEETALDTFFEKLIEFAESSGMQCGGGYNSEDFEVFVNTGRVDGANEELRQKFVEFVAAAKTEIKEFEATDLLDAYYDEESAVECGCHDGECGCGCN